MSFHVVAEQEGFYACTGWSTEDVIAEAEDLGREMTEEQAVKFLRKNSSHIVDAMVEAGFNAIQACFDFENADLEEVEA